MSFLARRPALRQPNPESTPDNRCLGLNPIPPHNEMSSRLASGAVMDVMSGSLIQYHYKYPKMQ